MSILFSLHVSTLSSRFSFGTFHTPNRSMLQRISLILTAPPAVNDDDYVKMKKLVGSLKGMSCFTFVFSWWNYAVGWMADGHLGQNISTLMMPFIEFLLPY